MSRLDLSHYPAEIHPMFKLTKSIRPQFGFLSRRLLWTSPKVALILFAMCTCGAFKTSPAADLLVEAEGFDSYGGWSLDTEFIQQMGSPYLMAHGLGTSVEDARTIVDFPESGSYFVHVRTMDWVARWKAEGSPGRFQVAIDGQPLSTVFGTTGADWNWQPGGKVEVPAGKVEIRLKDLTGFNGRVDAIYFTTDVNAIPPNGDFEKLLDWRHNLLGIDKAIAEKGPYDLVIVGGGYSGMGAAIAAARAGIKVALLQDRAVLGGNGSSEIRVWANGYIRRGKYPRIGEIIEEFADKATKSPGTAEEFGDDLKESVVRAEPNIDLFLNHFAYSVDAAGARIRSVTAMNTRTNQVTRFSGTLFLDATGHGTIGDLAGADWEMTPDGRMGMSNMWTWGESDRPTTFPDTPWALPLTMEDFPYPRDFHGQWFWESGFDKDPINEAEAIRDWNLRAVYGAFNAMKNKDGAADHKNAILTWVAYIGGPRESRRLMGDIVLTQDDIVEKRTFPDGCVPSTWTIDLHYPKKQYAEKFPDNPFISIAEHDSRIDRMFGYPVPYRCFYSRNIENLFMAGRNISVTHEALGTTRVMKTCGMMGEVVGKAAAICVQHNCSPRDVYTQHLSQLTEMFELPGKARRASLSDQWVVPEDALPLAGARGPYTGINPKSLKGVVVDDSDAKRNGKWTGGTGLNGYVGWGYQYASADSGSSMEFSLKAPADGAYTIRIAYLPHENRGSKVPVFWQTNNPAQRKTGSATIDMRTPADQDGWQSIGEIVLKAGEVLQVTIDSQNAGGTVHADAVQILPQP